LLRKACKVEKDNGHGCKHSLDWCWDWRAGMRRPLPSGRSCGGWWCAPRLQAEGLSLRTQRTVGPCSAVGRWWLSRVLISLRLFLVSSWTTYYIIFVIIQFPRFHHHFRDCNGRFGRSGRSFSEPYSFTWLRSRHSNIMPRKPRRINVPNRTLNRS